MNTKLEQELKEERLEEVCASCGIAEVDDVKLKLCNGGCDLVKYCSDNCQESNREQHDVECKQRKAEMHDKKLFTQPDGSHLGECPLCCLPLPLDILKSTMMPCCSKSICKGCFHANKKREIEAGLQPRCAFCREPAPKSEEEALKLVMERVKKNDPVAMIHVGKRHYSEGDYGKALEYYTKAAELGYVTARCGLGNLYYQGLGVEKDEKKAVYLLELAAIGGHANARAFLALNEKKNGRMERAAKHFIIAANLGHDNSLQQVKALFVQGIVSKEDYAAALRGHQAAVNETISAERVIGETVERLQKMMPQLGGAM
jgi:tetratricopeptide (TPR) repeat protein